MAPSSPDNSSPDSLIPPRLPWSPSLSASAHRHGHPSSSSPRPQHPVGFLPSPYDPPFSAPSPNDPLWRNPFAVSSVDSAPRRHPFAVPSAFDSSNVHHSFNPMPSMEVDYNGRALLPHQILASAFCPSYVHNEEDARLAEHRWERMVSDLRSKGKFRNSIAVYYVSTDMSETANQVSIAMTLLISELSQPPWKGKAFNFNESPYLFDIEGNSILDKAKFLRDYFEGSLSQYLLDYEMVFEQILEVAEDAKLKQDEMIKRVFLFTHYSFPFSSYYWSKVHKTDDDGWTHEHGMLSSMFSKAGYAMPKIVFCNLHPCFTDNPWVCSDTEEVQRMPYRIRQLLLEMSDVLVNVCQVKRMPKGVAQMVGGMTEDLLELFLEKYAVVTYQDVINSTKA